MKILVTGCSGFSGSLIAKELSSYFDIYGIYRNEKSKYLRNLDNTSLKLFNLDLNKIHTLNKKIKEIDIVIHIGSTSPNNKINNQKLLDDNIQATTKLIDWSIKKKCKKFIFFSSMSAFGDVTAKVVNEKTPSINPDFYGLTKLIIEKILYENRTILPSVSIRLPGIIGPGSKRNWLSNLKQDIICNKKIIIFNPESYFNNLIHIDDLTQLLKNILNIDFTYEIILVGTKQKIKIKEVTNVLLNELNYKSIIEFDSIKKNSFIIDSNKAMNKFNFCPKHIKISLEKFAHEN